MPIMMLMLSELDNWEGLNILTWSSFINSSLVSGSWPRVRGGFRAISRPKLATTWQNHNIIKVFVKSTREFEGKNGHVLPTGLWYAPSAVINDARYCMALHGIAWHCMVLHGIASYCIVLHGQGCISCGILVSGIGARGVSSEHMENMEMFSCSPT